MKKDTENSNNNNNNKYEKNEEKRNYIGNAEFKTKNTY